MNVPDIRTLMIESIRKIADPTKAIFIVKFSGRKPMVIKREMAETNNGQIDSQRWAAKLMRKTTGGGSVLKSRALSNIEKTGFFTQITVHQATLNLTNQLYGDIINPNNLDTLWVIMPLNEFFGNDFAQHDQGTFSTVANKNIYLRESMDDRFFWQGLGKILAVDMFNSNFDRFSPDGTLMNPGNIALHSQTSKPLPIDAWDASKSYNNPISDYRIQFTSINNNNINRTKIEDGLSVLRNDNNQMTNFAVKVIEDMLTEVGSDQALINNYKQTYQADLIKGLMDGRHNLKMVVRQKVAQYGGANKLVKTFGPKFKSMPGYRGAISQARANSTPATAGSIPVGLIERADYLGWL